MLRQHVLRDAEPRPPGRPRDALHRGLCRLPGLLADPGEHPHGQVPGPVPDHGLHPRESPRQAQSRPLPARTPDGGGHDRRGAEGGRLCDGVRRQVAPGRPGIPPRSPGFRREHRRLREGLPPVLFQPLQDAEPARRAAGRVPHRSTDRRGGPVHRGHPSGRRPVLPVPVPLRGPYPAAGEAGPRPEVQGQGGAPAAPERPRVPPRRRAHGPAGPGPSGVRGDGREPRPEHRPDHGDARTARPGRPDDRDLHVRQRRPVDVGRLAHLERPAARGRAGPTKGESASP